MEEKFATPFLLHVEEDKQESIPPSQQLQTKGKAARNSKRLLCVEGTVECRKTGNRVPLKTGGFGFYSIKKTGSQQNNVLS